MKHINKITLFFIGCIFTLPAFAAVEIVSSCSGLSQIDCSTYGNYTTSIISNTTPNLTNDTYTFSGMYCGGSANVATRKCYLDTTTQSVGLAMDCKYNSELHTSNTETAGTINIGSCYVGFSAYPMGASGSTASPGARCSQTSDCTSLSGVNGCTGWGCITSSTDSTIKTCQCVYCGSDKTVVSNKMGCNCIRNQNNCNAGYPGYVDGMYSVELAFIGDDTCLNHDTVCDGTVYYCQAGYWMTTSESCERCPKDAGGVYGTTAYASWYNYADAKTDCYISSGATGTDTEGSYTYTSNCSYKN